MKIPKGYIENAIYYITTRGDHEESIFVDEQDYIAYIDLVKHYKKQYGFKLYAFTLLCNHLHLLIELNKDVTVSQIMHDINSNYTKHFNSRHQRKGHLFQERSKMVVLEKDAYLLQVMTYIHLNPVKLGAVRDAKEYKYSSHALYLLDSSAPKSAAPQNDKNVRSFASLRMTDIDQEIKEIGNKYAEYFSKVTPEQMKALGKSLNKEVIMGTEEFKSGIEMAEAKKQHIAENAKSHNKKLILTGTLLLIILGIATFYLYTNSVFLRNFFTGELAKKDAELDAKLISERVKIYRDLDEKYRADMVSYQAMAKRLDIEKNKVKQLENKSH